MEHLNSMLELLLSNSHHKFAITISFYDRYNNENLIETLTFVQYADDTAFVTHNKSLALNILNSVISSTSKQMVHYLETQLNKITIYLN